MSLGTRAAIALGLVLLALVGAFIYGQHQFSAGTAAGRAAVLAEDAQAAAEQHQAQDDRDASSADTGNRLQVQISLEVPRIQVANHDTRQSIRTLYLDRPGDAGQCSRPNGVQEQLNAAIDRANAAARGDLRPHPAASHAAGSTGVP